MRRFSSLIGSRICLCEKMLNDQGGTLPWHRRANRPTGGRRAHSLSLTLAATLTILGVNFDT